MSKHGGVQVTHQPQVPLSQDAALVVGLAGTAMPFAHSAEDESERWLRLLRLHGRVGEALQALGVGESPLMTRADTEPVAGKPLGERAVRDVLRRAREFAGARRAECVSTADLLFAVFEIYGGLFDRALYARGASREELVERLAQLDRESAAAG